MYFRVNLGGVKCQMWPVAGDISPSQKFHNFTAIFFSLFFDHVEWVIWWHLCAACTTMLFGWPHFRHHSFSQHAWNISTAKMHRPWTLFDCGSCLAALLTVRITLSPLFLKFHCELFNLGKLCHWKKWCSKRTERSCSVSLKRATETHPLFPSTIIFLSECSLGSKYVAFLVWAIEDSEGTDQNEATSIQIDSCSHPFSSPLWKEASTFYSTRCWKRAMAADSSPICWASSHFRVIVMLWKKPRWGIYSRAARRRTCERMSNTPLWPLRLTVPIPHPPVSKEIQRK